MKDKIEVAELPIVWNQKYKDYFDVEITDDSEGVLQDIHWADGSIGYFPSYTLGNIYSGQILSHMYRVIPDWKNQIATGKFGKIKKWLTDEIYSYGNLYDPNDLMMKITDEEINIDYYLEYLNTKYSELYGF
jgi:carboxypeptidase Taq